MSLYVTWSAVREVEGKESCIIYTEKEEKGNHLVSPQTYES